MLIHKCNKLFLNRLIISVEYAPSWLDNRCFIVVFDSSSRQIKGRKVRAPKSRVPDNVWGAKAYDKCSREKTASIFIGKGERVR